MWVVGALATAVRADDGRPLPASPLLPPDHWSVAAVERLHEVGLLPEWMPAQRAAPIAAVARALDAAAERAEREAKAYAPLARAWRERFAAEWPRAAGIEAAPATLLGASASLGYEGASLATVAPASTRPAALLLGAAESRAAGSARAAATAGEHLAAGADVHVTATDATLRSGEVVGALGPVQLSVGRAPVGYGPNQMGAVVASGAAALDRVEFMTTEPIRLPWLLDALGEFALDTAVARFSEARHPYTPLLWEFDLQWRPHPRLTLGALRGVMFGGALWDGISARQVPLALLGIQNYRENNVYSGTVQYRLPSEALLPLTAKLEWGTDDEPAAAWKWPALVVGLAAPMLPGLPASVGVEYAYFGKGIGPPHTPFAWYAHSQYVGGWATGETPLGDALGGNGRALRLTASADPWGPRVRLAASAWVADRFADNLYAPQAAGRSVGGTCDAELRLGRTALGVRGSYERGRDGWSRAALSATTTAFF
jgi:Capsule assembly protein Wzi